MGSPVDAPTVHELEMELEECKRQVARERTRLFECEEISIRDTSCHTSGKGWGKAKARDKMARVQEGIDDVRLYDRYKESRKKVSFPLPS